MFNIVHEQGIFPYTSLSSRIVPFFFIPDNVSVYYRNRFSSSTGVKIGASRI